MSLVFGVSRVFRVQSSSHLSTVGVRHLRLASASTDDRQQLQSSTVNDRRLRFKSSTKRRPSVSVIYASAAHQSTSVIYQRRPSSKTTGLRKSLFFSARLQDYKSPHSSLQDNESPYSSQQDYRSPHLPSKTTSPYSSLQDYESPYSSQQDYRGGSRNSPRGRRSLRWTKDYCMWVLLHFWWTEMDFLLVIF